MVGSGVCAAAAAATGVVGVPGVLFGSGLVLLLLLLLFLYQPVGPLALSHGSV